jgi:hypothetical protein
MIGNGTCFTKWTILYQDVIDLTIHPPTSKHRQTSYGPHFLFVISKCLHLSLIMIIMEFKHIFIIITCSNYIRTVQIIMDSHNQAVVLSIEMEPHTQLRYL